jgi:hypothetical protein
MDEETMEEKPKMTTAQKRHHNDEVMHAIKVGNRKEWNNKWTYYAAIEIHMEHLWAIGEQLCVLQDLTGGEVSTEHAIGVVDTFGYCLPEVIGLLNEAMTDLCKQFTPLEPLTVSE